MTTPSLRKTYRIPVLLALLTVLVALLPSPSATADDSEWTTIMTEIEATLAEIPQHYADQDQTAVEAGIRKAYYELYQASGLQDQITHRLGRDIAARLPDSLLEIRDATREGSVTVGEVTEQVDLIYGQLQTDVEALASSEEVTDRWTRVANAIGE